MKQELKDIAFELATKTVPATLMTWWAQINVTAVLTVVLVVLQILYLVRKWWREETEWGMRLRRWASRHHITKPMELDE